MLESYKKTVLLLTITSCALLSVINYYEVTDLAIKTPIFNNNNPSPSIHDSVLIDNTRFKFLIKPQICKRRHIGLFVIVTIPSSVSNYDYRKAIRHTWGRWDSNMKVIFFVGTPETNVEEETSRIRMESDLYGDIVQGNFIDGYRNMSYKHVMILKWVAQFCSTAQFVVKIDDGVIVDLYRMYGLLEEYRWGKTDVMACHTKINATVIRMFRGLIVSPQDYAEQFYPPHCWGYTVVYSSDVVLRLLEASRRVPYFFIEDVYVTGLLAREAGVSATKFDIPSLSDKLGELLISNPSRLLSEGPYVLGPCFTDWRKMRDFWIPLQRYNFRIEKVNRRRNVKFYTIIPVGQKRKTLIRIEKKSQNTSVSVPVIEWKSQIGRS